jgi:hypothetical protein
MILLIIFYPPSRWSPGHIGGKTETTTTTGRPAISREEADPIQSQVEINQAGGERGSRFEEEGKGEK